MNKGKYNDLINKYLEGNTSLDEERQLLNEEGSGDIEPWLKYAQRQKMNTPQDMNEKIKGALQNRRQSKSRLLYTAISMAASIAILIGMFLYTSNSTGDSYAVKEAKLNEALAMFSDNDTSKEKQNVFYEDDLLVIYLDTE